MLFHFLSPIDNFLYAAILTLISEDQWANDWKDVLVLPLGQLSILFGLVGAPNETSDGVADVRKGGVETVHFD